MWQRLGVIITAIGMLLGIINALSPTKVSDLRLGFGFFLLRQFWLELVLIGVILWVPQSKWKKIGLWVWTRFPKFDSRQGKENVFSLLLLALIFLIPVVSAQPIISEAARAIKARIFFIKNLLYPAYRQELYQIGIQKEKLGAIDEAVGYYKHILEISSDNPSNKLLRNLIMERQGAIDYSGTCLEIGITTEKKRGLTRQSFNSLAQSFKLCPGNDLAIKELQERINRLKEAKDVPTKFFTAYLSNDEAEVARLFQEWKWYLLEEDIVKSIEFEPSGRPRKLNVSEDFNFLSRMSAEDFQQAVEKSWNLERILSFVSKKKALLDKQTDGED